MNFFTWMEIVEFRVFSLKNSKERFESKTKISKLSVGIKKNKGFKKKKNSN